MARVYEYNGRAYYRDDLERLLSITGDENIQAVLEGRGRELKEYKMVIDHSKVIADKVDYQFEMEGNDYAVNVLNERRWFADPDYRTLLERDYAFAKENNLLKAQLAEVIIPDLYFKKYGIDTELSIPMLFSIYAIVDGEVATTNLFEYIDDVNAFHDKVNSLFSTMVAKKQEGMTERQMKMMDAGTPIYSSSIAQGNTFLDGIIEDLMNEISTIEGNENIGKKKKRRAIDNARSLAAKRFAVALLAVNSQLITLGVRTPSTNASSGFIADVIGLHDNGNTLYSNFKRSLLDGHDHDIDQSSLYFYSDTDDRLFHSAESEELRRHYRNLFFEHEYEDQKIDKLSNDIVKYTLEYYKDPDNAFFTMDPIDLDPLREQAEKSEHSIFADGKQLYNDFTTNVHYHVISHDGDTVGPFALAMKGFTFFTTAYLANPEIVNRYMAIDEDTGEEYAINETEWNPDPVFIAKTISRIGALVNAATDNEKEMILGTANISIRNAFMVASMYMNPNDIMTRYTDRVSGEGREVAEVTVTEAMFDLLRSQASRDLNNRMIYFASSRINNKKTPYESIYGIMNVYHSGDTNKYYSRDAISIYILHPVGILNQA